MNWFAPYTIFGETRSARIEVWLNGEIIQSNQWDEERFIESEDMRAVMTTKNRRVRVVRREEWLRSKVIPTSESTPHEDAQVTPERDLTTSPYMQSMFYAQDIVEMLTDDRGANVRIIANAFRQYDDWKARELEYWPGFSRCKKCGKVSIAHPMRGCVNFVPEARYGR